MTIVCTSARIGRSFEEDFRMLMNCGLTAYASDLEALVRAIGVSSMREELDACWNRRVFLSAGAANGERA